MNESIETWDHENGSSNGDNKGDYGTMNDDSAAARPPRFTRAPRRCSCPVFHEGVRQSIRRQSITSRRQSVTQDSFQQQPMAIEMAAEHAITSSGRQSITRNSYQQQPMTIDMAAELADTLRQSNTRQSLKDRPMTIEMAAELEAAAVGAADFEVDSMAQPAAPRHARCTEAFKYFCSMALLIFSVVLVTGLIITKQTSATAKDEGMGLPPVLVFVVFWSLIGWLGMMEGGQGALVGLQPIERNCYASTHPVTFRNTSLTYKGENMERFIVGRQFLGKSRERRKVR